MADGVDFGLDFVALGLDFFYKVHVDLFLSADLAEDVLEVGGCGGRVVVISTISATLHFR